GPLDQLLGMIPGLANAKGRKDFKPNEKEIKRVEAIIYSMTVSERRKPESIDGSRRKRIASGSGTSVQDVNRLLKQFEQARKMMKQVTNNSFGGKQRPGKFPF
ncbi:MAG: signal recognition particle protein, partial [bacterium]|nr:signal recognition particle protein [bacterium]